jgi:universal stress protein A
VQISVVVKDLQIDLIVVSMHNDDWLGQLVLGSIAKQIMRHAMCPILIVRKHKYDFVSSTNNILLSK